MLRVLLLRFVNKVLLIIHKISSSTFIENWISEMGIFHILEPSERSDMQE